MWRPSFPVGGRKKTLFFAHLKCVYKTEKGVDVEADLDRLTECDLLKVPVEDGECVVLLCEELTLFALRKKRELAGMRSREFDDGR